MTYPVSYRRTSAPETRGYRTPSKGWPSPVRRTPHPANDNWPDPANDNRKLPREPSKQQQAVAGLRAGSTLARRAIGLAKVHPVLGKFIDVAQVAAGVYDMRVAEAMAFSRRVLQTNGYTVTMNCNGGGPVSHISDLSGWGTSCGAASPVVVNDLSMTCGPNPIAFYTWDYVSPYISQNFSYYWRRQRLARANPNPAAYVRYGYPLIYTTLPAAPPMVDPLSQPFGLPLETPQPIPYRQLPYRQANPWRNPHESSFVGYKPSGAYNLPRRLYGPQDGVAVQPGGGVEPYTPPVSPPNPKPPGPGVHERKGALRRGMMAALRVARGATEAVDAIDAVWKALPKKYRGKGKTPQDKMYAIWKNYRHLDMSKVAFNLFANHVIDSVVGRSNARADKFIKGWTGHHSSGGLNIWA